MYAEQNDALQHGQAEVQGRPLQAWLNDLRSDNPATAQEALQALGTLGPANADAVPELTEALKDPKPLVRAGAARALDRIGPAARQAVPAMESAGETGSELELRELLEARLRMEGSGKETGAQARAVPER
jgi:HEAT repeat protein